MKPFPQARENDCTSIEDSRQSSLHLKVGLQRAAPHLTHNLNTSLQTTSLNSSGVATEVRGQHESIPLQPLPDRLLMFISWYGGLSNKRWMLLSSQEWIRIAAYGCWGPKVRARPLNAEIRTASRARQGVHLSLQLELQPSG